MSYLIQYLSAGLGHILADNATVGPIYRAIDLLGPYAIGVVGLLSLIYSIILGVGYSKAENGDERKAAQKRLISFVVGAVVVLILIILLYALREPLSNWADSV